MGSKLPPFKIKTSLYSAPIKAKFDGSALLLLWLGNFDMEKTVKNNIEEVIKTIDWELHAQDFNL